MNKNNLSRVCCSSLILLLLVLLAGASYSADNTTLLHEKTGAATSENKVQQNDTMSMLQSIVVLREDTKKQITSTRQKIKKSTSDIEKANLEAALVLLDKQLAEANNDFERIATNIDVALFDEKKPEAFSWQSELTELVSPAIKELKRLTVRSRTKTRLRDTVTEYEKLAPVAHEAVQHIDDLIKAATEPAIAKQLKLLLPDWKNVEQRINNKLELSRLQLTRLEEQETNLSDSFSQSAKYFFRNRGIYLLGAVVAFLFTLLFFRYAYRFFFVLLPGAKQKQLPFHIRLIDLLYRFMVVVVAAFSAFLVLYLAEDWFLLSMAIIFILGFAWTIRQGASKLWQQARLMLNLGSIREGERVTIDGVAWKVERIHVFCILYNPSLDLTIRLPIEDMVGKVSREFKPEESWFPCKKGDWMVVGEQPRGRAVSISHETVELVERGGRRIFYRTQDFLASSPVNLSRNFRLRILFGISYDLQARATQEIPDIFQLYIEEKLKEEGYYKSCLNLSVEFYQAGDSSLDLLILADFKGEQAEVCAKLERFIQRCCVEACTVNNWEIPFPQLTFHWPAKEKQKASEESLDAPENQ